MKAAELREKSVTELKEELLRLRRAQFSLRMQLATQQSSNTAQLRQFKRDIARIKTVLTEKGVKA